MINPSPYARYEKLQDLTQLIQIQYKSIIQASLRLSSHPPTNKPKPNSYIVIDNYQLLSQKIDKYQLQHAQQLADKLNS